MESAKLPDDHPEIIAWKAYKQTEDFTNSVEWAAHPDVAIDGAMWGAFDEGWRARENAMDAVTRLGELIDTKPLVRELSRLHAERCACLDPKSSKRGVRCPAGEALKAAGV